MFFSSSDKPSPIILPEGVRYALRYRQGKLGRQEVTSLLQPKYGDIGFYLIMKALDGRPLEQQQLLEEILHFHVGNPENPVDSIDSIQGLLTQYLPANCQVEGSKLSQVMRIGPDTFDIEFARIAKRTILQKATPVLLAYSALLGFRQFASCEKMYILMPRRLSAPENNYFGFQLERTDNTYVVDLLNSCHQVKGGLYLVDDTIKTGKTFHIVEEFLENSLDALVLGKKTVVRVPLEEFGKKRGKQT